MNISVEISMYPLTPEYIEPIDNFLSELHQTKGLKVITNNMSTQVFGEATLVMHTLQKAILGVYTNTEVTQCPFVVKFLKEDVSDKTIKNYS